jgi:hypothetical protein
MGSTHRWEIAPLQGLTVFHLGYPKGLVTFDDPKSSI